MSLNPHINHNGEDKHLKIVLKLMENTSGTDASNQSDVYALVDEIISSDADFQAELEVLSDEDKADKVAEKTEELIRAEFANIVEKSSKDAELAENYKIRAKKAETTRKVAPPITNKDPQLSDELKLIARGLSDEAIDKAKIIAKGNGISLQEALKDDMFLAYSAKVAEDKKKEDAKLGASKGSGESQSETGISYGMSKEDHEKVFKEAMGN